MVSAEVIVLSSSPSRSLIATTPPKEYDRFWMSSSPSYPSPSQLLLGSHRPSLQGGSRANAIPAGALQGFTRASSLLVPENIVDTSTRTIHTASQLGQHKPPLRSLGPSVVEGEVVKANDAISAPLKKLRAPRKKSTNDCKSKTMVIEDRAASHGGDVLTKEPPVRKSKDVGGNKDDLVQGDSVLKKPRARQSKDEATITATTKDGVSTKKPRVRKSKDGGTGKDIIQGDPAVKKSRVRKSKDEGQKTIANTKIIKPSVAHRAEDVVKSDKDPVRKRRLPTTESIPAEGSNNNDVSDEPLGLDISIPRKRDWTPLRDDEALNARRLGETDGLVQQPSEDVPVDDILQAYNFSALHGDFSYVQLPSLATAIVPQRMVTGEALTKRQKLELIDIPGGPPVIMKPEKAIKAPKKKPQTITAKATAEFRPLAPSTASSPILQYLVPPSQELASGKLPEEAQSEEVAIKRVHKVPVRQKKPRDTATTAKKSAPILMTPEEAMKATKDQDLLFGTSSQLMREDSPSFVRDLQAAIQASESLEEVVDFNDEEITKPKLSATSLSVLTASKKLWSEAARDSQGELLDVEMIDLANTPDVQQLKKININSEPLRMGKGTSAPSTTDKTWKFVNDFASPAPIQPETTLDVFNIPGDDLYESVRSLPRCVAEAALRGRTKSRSPVKKTKLPVASNEPTKEMPRFQAYTTNELRKAISGYGFKPMKNRDAMVVLLEKCWESKTRLALQSLAPNTNIQSLAPINDVVIAEKGSKKSSTKRKGRPSKFDGVPSVEEVLAKTSVEPSISPVKPRGRPRKNTTLSTAKDNIAAGAGKATSETLLKPTKSKRKAHKPPKDDIEDPNPPPTPSPPRRRTPISPPQALPLANPALATTTKILLRDSFSSQTQPDLFAKITEAVTTFPPTHDPKNLTWYEKILLYDPIVLEDLATWLNTEGLGRVGVDEEIHPRAVRA
ncbi:5'-flap endonuclease, partial [Xylographa bjoerkii]|nr:5'-flap endonuclease [Xylographa bjoerkii]